MSFLKRLPSLFLLAFLGWAPSVSALATLVVDARAIWDLSTAPPARLAIADAASSIALANEILAQGFAGKVYLLFDDQSVEHDPYVKQVIELYDADPNANTSKLEFVTPLQLGSRDPVQVDVWFQITFDAYLTKARVEPTAGLTLNASTVLERVSLLDNSAAAALQAVITDRAAADRDYDGFVSYAGGIAPLRALAQIAYVQQKAATAKLAVWEQVQQNMIPQLAKEMMALAGHLRQNAHGWDGAGKIARQFTQAAQMLNGRLYLRGDGGCQRYLVP